MKDLKKSMEKEVKSIPATKVNMFSAESSENKILSELEAKLGTITLPREDVPAGLDKTILHLAAGKQIRMQEKCRRLTFVQRYVLPIAAVAAVCMCLPFVLKENTRQTPHIAGAALSQSLYNGDEYSLLNTELLLLSGSIQDSTENMTGAAALSAALDIYK